MINWLIDWSVFYATLIDWLIDWSVFYAILAVFRPINDEGIKYESIQILVCCQMFELKGQLQ